MTGRDTTCCNCYVDGHCCVPDHPPCPVAAGQVLCASCGREGTRGFTELMGYTVCVARAGACSERVHKQFGYRLTMTTPARES